MMDRAELPVQMKRTLKVFSSMAVFGQQSQEAVAFSTAQAAPWQQFWVR